MKIIKNNLWNIISISILLSSAACATDKSTDRNYPFQGMTGPQMGTLYPYLERSAIGRYTPDIQSQIPLYTQIPQQSVGFVMGGFQEGTRYLVGSQGETPFYGYLGVQGPQGPLTGGSYTDPATLFYTQHEVRNSESDRQFLTGKLGSLSFSYNPSLLYKTNYLDFSDFDVSRIDSSAPIYEADLSTIRTIDVSCDSRKGQALDANAFLKELFIRNSSLRSLTVIEGSGSNLTQDALELLRDKADFKGPIIRDMWKISERTGKKIATIQVHTQNTPLSKLEKSELQKLQIPSQEPLSIVYRSDNYLPGSVAYIQLELR